MSSSGRTPTFEGVRRRRCRVVRTLRRCRRRMLQPLFRPALKHRRHRADHGFVFGPTQHLCRGIVPEERRGRRWSTEDAASAEQTPACLRSSMAPTKSCFAGWQKRQSQFKSRPGKFITYAFLINTLQELKGKTLGHYWFKLIVLRKTGAYIALETGESLHLRRKRESCTTR